MKYPDIKEMVGKTASKIMGCEPSSSSVIFLCTDGTRYNFHHDQECCESVSVNEVIGDVSDLIGEPLLMAEQISSDDAGPPLRADSFTWTFYKFATINGYVTVRWLGESNGYYSEGVSLSREDV